MENPEMVNLPEKQKHQLRHRELFLSRQLESLPATHIRYVSLPPSPDVCVHSLGTILSSCRGKCCVTLLNETEALKSYLDREVREIIAH